MYSLEFITVELYFIAGLLVYSKVVASGTASPPPEGRCVSVLPAEPGDWSSSWTCWHVSALEDHPMRGKSPAVWAANWQSRRPYQGADHCLRIPSRVTTRWTPGRPQPVPRRHHSRGGFRLPTWRGAGGSLSLKSRWEEIEHPQQAPRPSSSRLSTSSPRRPDWESAVRPRARGGVRPASHSSA